MAQTKKQITTKVVEGSTLKELEGGIAKLNAAGYTVATACAAQHRVFVFLERTQIVTIVEEPPEPEPAGDDDNS